VRGVDGSRRQWPAPAAAGGGLRRGFLDQVRSRDGYTSHRRRWRR
jgi:hypothetical protein